MTAPADAVPIDPSRFSKRVRQLETSPPVRAKTLDTLLLQVNFGLDVIVQNWETLPEQLRQPLKLGFYQLADRRRNIFDRFRLSIFLLRFATDREMLRQYFDTAARIDEIFYDLIENDDPRHAERLSGAISDLTPAPLPSPVPESIGEWSAWLRSL